MNPLRIFIPLSALFVFGGVLTLGLSWYLLKQPLDVTAGLLIQTGIILLTLGMLADLIGKRIS